jgi:cysteine sulfinate desulfinase/cysteine desulfurase-like protein
MAIRSCTGERSNDAETPMCYRSLRHYYETDCANIHRGVHELSERATTAYEEVRTKLRQFINAGKHEEVVFVRGITEAINLVALHGVGRTFTKPTKSSSRRSSITQTSYRGRFCARKQEQF